MIRRFAFALAVFASACATAPPAGSVGGEQVIGSMSIADARGLSQDEFRQRLGLVARDESRLSVLFLDESEPAYIVNRDDILRGSRCPEREGYPYTRMMIRGPDAFVFRAGGFVRALSGGTYDKWTDGQVIQREDATISLSCWYASSRADGGSVVGDMIMVAPWTPLIAVGAALTLLPDTDEALLATVRVGEELPGGYRQFVSANRGKVQVDSENGADVELSVRGRGQPLQHALAWISLREGVVVRIETRNNCFLGEDQRSAVCAR